MREPEAPAPAASVAPPIAVEPEIVPTAGPVATGPAGPPRLDLDTYAEDAAITESEHELRRAEQSVAGPPRLVPSPEDADAVAAGADSEEEALEIVTSVEPDEAEVVFDLDEAAAAVPDAPGLQFESPVAAAPAPEPIAEAPATGLQRVEKLLANAQQHFRSGEREAAGDRAVGSRA